MYFNLQNRALIYFKSFFLQRKSFLSEERIEFIVIYSNLKI